MTSTSSPESSSQAIYLLGNEHISPLVKRYRILREAFASQGEFLSVDAETEWLACYDRDSQHLHTRLPLLVFRPHTIADLTSFIRTCSKENIAIKVRCGGTSLTGASVAGSEGVVVLTGHFKKVVHYQPENGRVSVEPGVTPDALNAWVGADGWCFPLEMAINGAAGLAGCLSCHAKGYHQRGRPLYQCIRSATIVDGKGDILQVPPELICGMEGILGVIIRLELQLMCRPKNRMQASCQLPWESLWRQLPALRYYQAIVGLSWQDDQFTFHLEGDMWRIAPTFDYLAQRCGAVTVDSPLPPFYPQTALKQFILVSSACLPQEIPKGIQLANDYAKEVGLHPLVWADVWFGAIHLQLSSSQDVYHFNHSLAHFFLLWIEWLESVQGFVVSAHGIGQLVRPYLPPFIKEEDMGFLKRLQVAFDPFHLFAKDHFFPETGKCVEQRVMPRSL